uniref:Peptidase n=1 Tax=uncultured marine thaumarchaeote KM3_31_G08 TaxID=1456121 RepID=A0A075GXU8_9ARCH|nr:hypothetical protein [uncultured marine thaumarchaeote KM3_31_G08]
MRNQHPDSKIFSILSRTSRLELSLIFGFLLIVLVTPLAFAEVFIPSHEYVGFFDSNGIYTVVGNVKNDLEYAIIPTISISVMDGTEKFSKTIQHVPLTPGNEIPFKIKFPEIVGNDPILLPAEITFEKTHADIIPIDVIYDETLIVHDDGHLTGRIINSGTETISDFKIYAVIHGYDDETLDMGENFSTIPEMKPGEIREFTMYPDPKFSSDVWYYSCFAVGQDSIIVLNVPRNDDTFKIRYDSSILLSYPEFDLKGETLSFSLIQGWEFQNYINLEFPKYSEEESFDVFLNDEHIDFIQSIDDMGNWHVAFFVDPKSKGILKITGFEPDGKLIETILIPEWIRNDASWWSTDQISDLEFLQGINYLFEKQIVSIPQKTIVIESQWKIPSWVKNPVGWWNEEKISDDEFLNIIENLVKQKIIVV